MAANTLAEILALKTFLEEKYADRDEAFKFLRRLYNSDYWSGKEVQGMKLVYNLIANAVDRYTDFMTQPPDWRVIPADMTDEAIAMADKQEKLLYSQWELNNINIQQQWQAFLQSLLGMFAWIVLPKMDSKEQFVDIQVGLPEFVWPMPRTDNVRDLDSVIIKGFDYNLNKNLYQPELRHDQRLDPNVLHYLDKEKIVIIKDQKEEMRIVHNFGFIPVVVGVNRPKTHFVEGIGDTDQAIGMNTFLNELLSWQADIIEYAANPITIIKGYTGDPLPTGPGAQWNLNREDSVSFLQWAGQAPTVENLINRVIQSIQDMTNLGDPIFGREVPSGTSGAAVRTLMSGIQAAMLRKQVMLGEAYVHVNEIIFKIIEKMFGSKEITIRGTKKGQTFVTKFKGSEINGNVRNQAIWPPGVLDMPSRLNVETLKFQAGLQSKFTTMENVGILSPKDELDRIRIEQIKDIELQGMAQNPTGLNPQRNREFSQAANQLQQLGPAQQEAPLERQLIEFIRQVPRIKGNVFFGGREGENFTIVLTDMRDKATIVNRLPEELKGRLTFRRFKEDQDDDLTVIIDREEATA